MILTFAICTCCLVIALQKYTVKSDTIKIVFLYFYRYKPQRACQPSSDIYSISSCQNLQKLRYKNKKK